MKVKTTNVIAILVAIEELLRLLSDLHQKIQDPNRGVK